VLGVFGVGGFEVTQDLLVLAYPYFR